MNLIGESLCAQLLLYPLSHFNDIWYTYISGENGMSHARMVAPLSCPSDLSPLNKLDREKLASYCLQYTGKLRGNKSRKENTQQKS